MIFASILILIIGLMCFYIWAKNIKGKTRHQRTFVEEPLLPTAIMFTVIGIVFLIAEILNRME